MKQWTQEQLNQAELLHMNYIEVVSRFDHTEEESNLAWEEYRLFCIQTALQVAA